MKLRPLASSLRQHRLALALLVGLMLAVAWLVARSLVGTPARLLASPWHRQSTVTDRHGVPLRTLPSQTGVRGIPIPLERMGNRLVTATLYSEDRRFFEHAGIDYQAVLRAMGQNIADARIVSGASTISQQLVKLLDHQGQDHRRTLWRKLSESMRAQNLEQQLSKTEILTAYLNRLNYGRGLTGPENAARTLFEKPPSELSWAEAALLAVLPRAPSYLDPYKHRQRALKRQRALLATLADYQVLSAEELQSSLTADLAFAVIQHEFEAPHWVDKLAREQQLCQSQETRTTLDLALQRDAETILRGYRQRLLDRGADNAAAVVIDNRSGEILAYVGSVDYHNGYAAQVDHASAPRQAGSTLKPFVYALAFTQGTAAHEPLADVPRNFGRAADGYAPHNFDDVFHGPVSAHTALASSLNLPAVALAASLPEGALLHSLRRLGLSSLSEDTQHYGLSLALGSGEVSLAELVVAYATLARQGQGLQARTTVANAVELGRPQTGAQVLDGDAVRQVTHSLSDPLARVLGLGGAGPRASTLEVALKTGTSSGYRDAWTVGYTREITVGVWVGNSSGAPTKELTGASGAGPIFADLLERAMEDVERPDSLLPPESMLDVMVCPLSGLATTDACPGAVRRRVAKAQLDRHSEHQCPWHRHALPTSAGGYACAEQGSRRVVALPDEYSEWLEGQAPGAPGRDPDGLAWLVAAKTPGCAEGKRPRISVEYPAAGSVLVPAGSGNNVVTLDARAQTEGMRPNEPIEFVLDGQPIARVSDSYQTELRVGRGDHELLVRPADANIAAELGRVLFSVR